MTKVLIVGCGAIGMALGDLLIAQGHQVTGLKRNPPQSDPNRFKFFNADICSGAALKNLDDDFEQVFFIVSPDERTEQLYRNIYELGLNNLLRKFGASGKTKWLMVSSTSVYNQSQGEWVDEDSTAEPDNPCSQLIREAERRLIDLDSGNTVVRFSGIYGKGREYLLRVARQAPEVQQNPPYYTNRIHQQDCVRVLAFLLERRLAGVTLAPIYLASDDNPAAQWEVMTWLTQQMACKPPAAKMLGDGANMNKRCNNQRLKRLGYEFLYPTYQEGYRELINCKG